MRRVCDCGHEFYASKAKEPVRKLVPVLVEEFALEWEAEARAEEHRKQGSPEYVYYDRVRMNQKGDRYFVRCYIRR